ncbi:MAG: PKD domain-containing protein, partial [Methanoregula sp.]|nr:PKD domain-containing protein [Methanoregula sp.]
FTFSTSQNPAQVFGIGHFRIVLNATNSGGFNVSTQVTFINVSAPTPAPVVTGITPSTGVNTTPVSITDLAGANFLSGATVILTPVNATPVHKGSIVNGTGSALLNNPNSVYVAGNYAYVASQNSSALEIVNVTNPAVPVHIGSIVDGEGGALLNETISVFVSGNYAFVTSTTNCGALEIVDVTNPAAPVHKGSIVDGEGGTLWNASSPRDTCPSSNSEGGALLNYPNSVYVSGNYAYVTSQYGNALEIVDVSDPAAPVHKGSIVNGTGGALLDEPYSVYVSGNYAYVASANSNALEIVDVSIPAAPVHQGSIVKGDGGALLDSPRSVYVSGNNAYVVSFNSGSLEIVDVSNPASPALKGNIVNGTNDALLDFPNSVYVSGNYAYVVSSGSSALEIVDVTNPVAPAHKGSIVNGTGGALLGQPYNVYVSENYAYVTSGDSNALEIIDIGTVAATGVTVDSSTKITGTFNLNSKIAGPYNVVVTNTDGKFGTLPSGFTVTNISPAPTVTGITPATGQNTTTISITNLAGTGFYGSPVVNLTKTGQSNITATGVTVVSATNITCTFDLNGKSVGQWTINVTNPDGQVGAFVGGFRVTNITPPPVTGFTADKTNGTAPLAVKFSDTTTNAPTGWAWFFGDENFTQAWTQQTANAEWTARHAHSSVVLPDGSIVLTGGSISGTRENDTWRSMDKGTTWTQVNAGAGWMARSAHSSVVMSDGSIVLMGGWNGSSYYNDTWQSTDNGVTWTQVNASSGWSARAWHNSIAMPDDSIVLMGGDSIGETYTNDTWRSTDKGTTWTQVNAGAGWTARYGQSSIVMPDGSIVLMGGDSSGEIYTNDTWRSTDNGATWTQVNASSGWSARAWHNSIAMPDGSIVLMGGYDGSVYYPDVWRSTDNGAMWTQVNASAGWTPRAWHSSVAMPDGSIVLMGGQTGSGNINDVWRFVPAGSLQQNPSYTYIIPGTYQVSLQAYNAGGYNSTRKTGYIAVNAPAPVVTGITPATGQNTTTISITNLAGTSFYGSPLVNLTKTGQSNITATEVTVVDSTNITCTFDLAGKTVGLWNVTVVNPDKQTGSLIGGFLVTNITPAPVADFTGIPRTGTEPLTVTFTDNSTNTPTSWNWSFGDGSLVNATVQHPVHTYAMNGTYTVSLNATNAGGSNTKTAVDYITVNVPAPVADFTGIPRTGTEPLTVTFTDNSTNTTTSWNWSFGDGSLTNATVQ